MLLFFICYYDDYFYFISTSFFPILNLPLPHLPPSQPLSTCASFLSLLISYISLYLSLYHYLFSGVDKVSPKLVSLVKEISSGNAFWCRTIANFILENGDEEFVDAVTMKASISNSLQFLVVCLFEKLTPEQQMVAKYASIIGHEFNDTVLKAVLPAKLLSVLREVLEG